MSHRSLETKLRELAGWVQPGDVPGPSIEAGIAARVRTVRRRRLGASLLAIALVGALAATATLNSDPPDRSEVVANEPTTPSLGSSATGDDPPAVPPWQKLVSMPISAREGATTTFGDGHVFVWGGRDSSSGELLSDGAVYSVDAASWQVIPQSPGGGRYGSAAIWIEDEFVVVGGWSQSDPDGVRTPLAYNLVDKEWRALPEMTTAGTVNVALAAQDGELLAVGGFEGRDGPPSSSSAVLDLVTGSWRVLDDAPWPIVGASAYPSRPGSGAFPAATTKEGLLSVGLAAGATAPAIVTISTDMAAGNPTGLSDGFEVLGSDSVGLSVNDGKVLVFNQRSGAGLVLEADSLAVSASFGPLPATCDDHLQVSPVVSGWIVINCDAYKVDVAGAATPISLPQVSTFSLVDRGGETLLLGWGIPEGDLNAPPQKPTLFSLDG